MATLVNHLLACLVGEWVSTLLTPNILRWVLGISFLAVAAWALIPDKLDEDVKTRGHYGIFVSDGGDLFLGRDGR